jgi:hypothetical protein
MSTDGRVLRLTLAAGLLIGLVGFVYDWAWHAQHLSPVPIGPATLLRVHSGIYVGQAIVLGVAVCAAQTRAFGGGWLRAGQMVLLAGAVIELCGNLGDFWSHSRQWESPVFHQSMYAGLALSVAGYLVIELAHVARPGVPAGVGAGR